MHHSVSMIGFNKIPLHKTDQYEFFEASSPRTISTVASSQGSNSLYASEDEGDFESSAPNHLMRT